MEYRSLGRTGLSVSAIGLGTEHLIEAGCTIRDVIHQAVEAGITYIDVLATGNSVFWQDFAPATRPTREKLILAVGWNYTYLNDMDRALRDFEESLAIVGNDYADVAMIRCVDTEENWQGWGQKSLEHLERLKAQGRVGFIGVSGHFPLVARKAVESGLIDVLMYQISLANHDNADVDGLCAACLKNNVGLVAMKPYHGGALLNYEGRTTSITPVQCLAHTLSRPVATTVPGVKNVEELQSVLMYLQASEAEKDWKAAIPLMHQELAGYCARCNHCLPCPADIDIGQVILFVGFADWSMNDNLRARYHTQSVTASACVECNICVERCPFDVDVIAKMHRAVEIFGK